MSDSDCPVIEKYGGRFYDTGSNTYVTLDDLGRRVRDGQSFTVVDKVGAKDLTQQVLAHLHIYKDTTHYMRMLIREGKLPHDLLAYHWFRGTIKELGPHEILLPGGCDYFPVDDIKVLTELPPSLAKKAYDVRRVEERFQQFRESMHAKNQAIIAAGNPGMDVEDILKNRPGYPGQIDGITCYLMGTWLEKINHKTVVDAVLKPLGYAKSKGEKYRYQKRLSETDFLTCGFDMHAMWGRIREYMAWGISSWRGRRDSSPDLLGGFSLDRMDESRKYESNDDYHRAHIYHGHREHRLSAHDTGSELPGRVAQGSKPSRNVNGVERPAASSRGRQYGRWGSLRNQRTRRRGKAATASNTG